LGGSSQLVKKTIAMETKGRTRKLTIPKFIFCNRPTRKYNVIEFTTAYKTMLGKKTIKYIIEAFESPFSKLIA
jgi:hypothetical protein